MKHFTNWLVAPVRHPDNAPAKFDKDTSNTFQVIVLKRKRLRHRPENHKYSPFREYSVFLYMLLKAPLKTAYLKEQQGTEGISTVTVYIYLSGQRHNTVHYKYEHDSGYDFLGKLVSTTPSRTNFILFLKRSL